MTWVLSASGHTPAPEGASDWHDVEQKLHDELAAVLSKPEYGCGSSSFSGNHVQSNAVHLADDPDTEHVHEVADPRAGNPGDNLTVSEEAAAT